MSCIGEEDEEKLLKQIEFYFSDANLKRDKFLRHLVVSSPQAQVKLDVLLTFNRVKKLLSLDSIKDPAHKPIQTLANVLAKANTLNLSDDKTSVSRKQPWVEAARESHEQSVRFTGFPKETTLEQLESFFDGLSKGNVAYIHMIRYKDPSAPEKLNFSGNVHVEWKTKEIAEQVLGKKDMKFKDQPLKLCKLDPSSPTNAKSKAKAFSLVLLKGAFSDISREDIAEAFGMPRNYTSIKYNRGDQEAIVGFDTEDSAKKAVETFATNKQDLLQKKDQVEKGSDESALESTVLTGDELVKYLEVFQSCHFKRKGRHNSFGKRGNKKRKQSHEPRETKQKGGAGEAEKPKKPKTEAAVAEADKSK